MATNDLLSLPPSLRRQFVQWRETCNISLEQVSEITGLSNATIQTIEDGGYCTNYEYFKYNDFVFDYLLQNEKIIREMVGRIKKSYKNADNDDFISDVEWEEVE